MRAQIYAALCVCLALWACDDTSEAEADAGGQAGAEAGSGGASGGEAGAAGQPQAGAGGEAGAGGQAQAGSGGEGGAAAGAGGAGAGGEAGGAGAGGEAGGAGAGGTAGAGGEAGGTAGAGGEAGVGGEAGGAAGAGGEAGVGGEAGGTAGAGGEAGAGGSAGVGGGIGGAGGDEPVEPDWECKPDTPCPEGEICWYAFEDFPDLGVCYEGCNPVSREGCDEGESCYLADDEGGTLCFTSGDHGHWEDCSGMELCADGGDCFQVEPGRWECRPFCDDRTPCPNDSECMPSGRGHWSACLAP